MKTVIAIATALMLTATTVTANDNVGNIFGAMVGLALVLALKNKMDDRKERYVEPRHYREQRHYRDRYDYRDDYRPNYRDDYRHREYLNDRRWR